VNVRVPEPPLNEQDVGLYTGPPEIVQLVSLESYPESVTVTKVPGIPLEGSKVTDGVA
jgi:hypothetical protein